MSLTRRSALAATTLFLVAAATPAVFAQRVAPPAEVSVDELMKQTDLPDIAIGAADAKVTVVEYASMTCGHCANFAIKVFPEFKKKYIDTGKVRFISREFPLDDLAAAASMLTRCAEPAKSFDLVEVLFQTQAQWAYSQGNKAAKLFEVVKQAGFTQEAFDKCLTNQGLLDKVTAARTRATEKFQISSTPTFFINGKRLAGSTSVADFDKIIEPLLAATK